MIAWWPGKVPAGKVSDQVWAFWDVFPTLTAVARADAPQQIDGINMLPALMGRAQTNQHEFLYWEFHEGGSKQAVRMGDWKGVRTAPGRPLELYDIKADPAEKTDLALERKDIVAKIDTYLQTARTESETWPLKAPKAAPSETPKKN